MEPKIIIERDLEIPMDDGIVLRADLFRPETAEKVPVVMNYGLYGKGLRYQEGYALQWQWLITRHPEILDGSTGDYLTWETVDPERWVPSGYAVLRVDSRGAGRSPGLLDPFSPREGLDFYTSIEWAAGQPWCNGKVGLCGISYYAMNQWTVAALQPPHLAAIIPWEGAADQYRDVTHHGGILSNAFLENWYPRQVLAVQHGRGVNGPIDPWTGEPATGPETLTEEQRTANRTDILGDVRRHKLDDDYHRFRSGDLSKITVPLLSAANWGGLGLHSRGNFDGFVESSSPQKWLEVHPGRHDEAFYLPYAVELQKRFFDHFLKGEDNGWDRVPPVMLNIRRPDRSEYREEHEWPLARTRWTKLHLDTRNLSLSWDSPPEGRSTSAALGDGLTFVSAPLEAQTEITGPSNAIMYVSSSTSDADLFITLRAFDPDGNEIDFQGGLDPHTPLAQGWLRASQRKIDPVRSKPYKPYYPHDEIEPLEPGRVYRLEVEVWPTCIVLPVGYRIALTVGGRDFERRIKDGDEVWRSRGSGPFIHNDPEDRPISIFGGTTTVYTENDRDSYLLLPIVTPRSEEQHPESIISRSRLYFPGNLPGRK